MTTGTIRAHADADQRELDRRFVNRQCLLCGDARPIDDLFCETHTTRTVPVTARRAEPDATDARMRRGIAREAKRRGVTPAVLGRSLRAGLPLGVLA